MKKNKIRIIGGKFKGKRISFPSHPTLRPTLDQTKETLFNWLQPHLYQADCLDAFAGSGSIGFEAYSRGANTITMLELNMLACQTLRAHKESMCLENMTILQTNTINWLENCKKQFHLIFLDPPYNSDLLEKCLDIIIQNNQLTKDGLIYFETTKEKYSYIESKSEWKIIKHKNKSTYCYGLLEKKSLYS